MSEETTTPEEKATEKHAYSIKQIIADKLKASAPIVKESIIQQLVDAEILVRKELIITKGLNKLDELNKELKKLKPDNISYDSEGKVLSETWTKAAVDNAKKIKDTITKVENAIEKALTENNYDLLRNL